MSRPSLKIVNTSGCNSEIHNQNGSIILIVLMLLVMMSVIGISSTNTTVMENFIVRNTAIRKQNLHMADAAAMEIIQHVLDAGLSGDIATTLEIDNIRPGMPDTEDWIRLRSEWEGAGNLYDDWYDEGHVGRILVGGASPNSMVPVSIANTDIDLINDRGEWDGNPDNSPIRCALVGWEFKPSANNNLNLAAGQPILRTANILTEYLSERNGIIRLTVGVERAFMN